MCTKRLHIDPAWIIQILDAKTAFAESWRSWIKPKAQRSYQFQDDAMNTIGQFMKRKLPEGQAHLAVKMREYDQNVFADPVEVISCLNSLDENGLRPFNYDYYYLNLLAIFGAAYNPDEIARMAIACNKFRLWSRWECYSEPFRSSSPRRAQFRLQGWDVPGISSLLEQGRGLVIYTFHYGAFRSIYQDLLRMNREPWLSVDTDSAVGLRRRAQEQGQIPEVSDTERIIDVEHPLAAVRIAKLLQKNQVVIVFADGNGGVDGPWGKSNKVCIDFMGYPISVKSGIAKVAAAVGAPVLPVFTRRTAPLNRATERSSVVGEVECKPAIRFSEETSATEHKESVRKCIETMFGYFEKIVTQDPTQWESACLVHRWRGVPEQDIKDMELSASSSVREAAVQLFEGGRFHLNKDRVARIPTDEGAVLVNVRNLRVFRIKKDLEEFVSALSSARGVGEERCDAHNDQSLRHIASFLAALQQLGLVQKI
jgi:lauroyl/myristoyl acyltransferase